MQGTLRLVALLLSSSAALAAPSAKVELGRRLFLDPTVSRGARFSCASCHSPEHGFSDPRALSEDENGFSARHSQPLLGLKDGSGMHWDGEFFTVRELLVARLGSLQEARAQAISLARRHFSRSPDGDRGEFERRVQSMRPPYYEGADLSITRAAPLARRLDEEGRYAAGFRAAFGSSRVTTDRLVDAMEAYVLSLRSGKGAYDRHVAGDKDALSLAARRGLELFKGKAGCAECHSGPRFTDDLYHNTGVSFLDADGMDLGRGDRTFRGADRGRFKTPSLRDVSRRAPYMHDGTFRTLRDVVLYYDRGGTPNAGLDPHVRRLDLQDGEIDDLVAFLESLASDERPGLGPATHRGTARVRLEDLEGKPINGLAVRVVPFGDRLRHEGASGAAFDVTTDRAGWLSFRFPYWTHVRLEARGLSIGEGQPLPDTLREITLVAAPRVSTAVRILSPVLPEKLTATAGNDGPVHFRRVRRLGPGEALYLADHTGEGSAVVTFLDLPFAAVQRRYAMDLSEGFTQAIDLRPDPEVRVPVPPGIVSVVPSAAAENGARENVGSDRAAARRDR